MSFCVINIYRYNLNRLNIYESKQIYKYCKCNVKEKLIEKKYKKCHSIYPPFASITN